jgi:hypothetical protein
MRIEFVGERTVAFRRGARAGAVLALTVALAQAQPIELRVRHVRLGKDCTGTLRFDETQVAWTPAKASKACVARVWPYAEMRKLEMRERRIDLAGYQDHRWKLGEDERWRFTLTGDPAGEELYRLLRAHMDSRFAPLWAEPDAKPEWSVGAKLLSSGFASGNWGSEGVLDVGVDRVTFRSAKAGYSHTWLDKEIENASAEPPFLLTLSVREGGEAKTREFQLKQELDAARFDALWQRLNRPRGLRLLDEIEEKPK